MSLPVMMRVELADPIGKYVPDPLTEVPVMPSFAAVTRPDGPVPCLGWATLLRRGNELWAELKWTTFGCEHVFKYPLETELELAYAATVKGYADRDRPGYEELERILFLVIRPATVRR